MVLDSVLEQVQSVGISGHVRPDGDCTGSTLAVYNYIKTYYPQVEVALYLEPIPNKYRFMAGANEIIEDCTQDKVYDLFISLDCGSLDRLGDAQKYFHAAKKTFCIDHHISNTGFADVEYVYPEASSASELVYELLEDDKITKEIAECIYVGIVSDTGVFQYSCTSSHTMNIAGKLMDKGIDYTNIIDESYYIRTYEQNRILGLALLKARLHLDGKVISTVITTKEMEEYHVLPKHLDGIVQQLRITRGVEAAIFMYENSDGTYKVSMRANHQADVARVMVAFGGGGHVKAAGATVSGDVDEVLHQILDELAKQLS